MKHHKDNLTFRIIDTNPTKNTVTLRPTFGTILKMNLAAGALLYCGKLLVERMLDAREDQQLQKDLNELYENEN